MIPRLQAIFVNGSRCQFGHQQQAESSGGFDSIKPAAFAWRWADISAGSGKGGMSGSTDPCSPFLGNKPLEKANPTKSP